jgi:DNA-binding transcriptional LysR family regulator
MDTNRIRYFLSLAQTGNIARAAELHRISPPAFSKAMKVFEDEVGQKLLVPHGRGILLTDAAKALVPELQNIIQQIDRVVGAGDKIASALPILKLATFEVFSTYFMEKAFDSVFRDYQCLLLEMIPGEMEQAVASRKVDLALTYNPIPHPELDFLKVQAISMGVFGLKKFRGQEFAAIPFAVPVASIEGAPSKVKGLDGWPDDRLRRKIDYRVEMMESALGLCRRGLACSYLPRFVVRLHNDVTKAEYHLVEIDSPRPAQKDFVYLIKRKADVEDAVAKKLGAFVRKVCGAE